MSYFNIELIDVSEAIANFKFTKVSQEDLTKILACLKNKEAFLEFQAGEGSVLLATHFFRGIMYAPYEIPQKTIIEENKEGSVEITKVKLKKSIFSNPEGGAVIIEGNLPDVTKA